MATTADGALVEAARAGDQRAFGQLFDAWFDRVHDVSRRIVHDDGIAGEVAQDTFLRAWTKLDTLDDVDAFGGWVLRIGRNASLNRLEKERRSTVLDDESMTTLTDAASPDHDPLARLDQAGRIALVWDAAAALGERDASVLDLHLRHGLGAAELAEELGTNANNAHQVLFTLRKRLGNAVRALVLWRAGHPTCGDLRESLAAAGLNSFGAPMVKAIDRHVARCDTCAEDRTERLSPAALFAAAPVVAAPSLLKAKAAAALGDASVPMAGSSASASASASGVAGPSPSPMTSPGAPIGPVGGAIGGAGDGGGGADDLAAPAGDDGGHGSARSALARRRALVAAALLAVVCLGAALWWATRPDGDDEVLATAAAATSSTTEAAPDDSTTTTAPTSSTGPEASTATVLGAPAPTGAPVPTVADAGPGTTAAGTLVPGTTPGSTVAPAGPTTTAPAAPSTTRPPVATTTTTEPIPAPVVDGFRATASTTICRGGYRWTLVWATTGADRVRVGPSEGTAVAGAPDGRAVVCAPPDSSFTLAASGPGGVAVATVQGRGPTTSTAPG